MIYIFFAFGLGFYIALCVARYRLMKNADVLGLCGGFLFGVILWPVGLFYELYNAIKAASDENSK